MGNNIVLTAKRVVGGAGISVQQLSSSILEISRVETEAPVSVKQYEYEVTSSTSTVTLSFADLGIVEIPVFNIYMNSTNKLVRIDPNVNILSDSIEIEMTDFPVGTYTILYTAGAQETLVTRGLTLSRVFQDEDGLFFCRLDDTVGSFYSCTMLHNAKELHLLVRAIDTNASGNVALQIYLNGANAISQIVPVDTIIQEVVIPITRTTGTLEIARDIYHVDDTLKQGDVVLTCRVYDVWVKEGV